MAYTEKELNELIDKTKTLHKDGNTTTLDLLIERYNKLPIGRNKKVCDLTGITQGNLSNYFLKHKIPNIDTFISIQEAIKKIEKE